jgi:RHH-type rel operon transcriptional repressor/antitoxin RelB
MSSSGLTPWPKLPKSAEHTGRSRGVYSRLALSAFLLQLEEDHWNQTTARFERDGFDRDVAQITTQLMEDPKPSP